MTTLFKAPTLRHGHGNTVIPRLLNFKIGDRNTRDTKLSHCFLEAKSNLRQATNLGVKLEKMRV